MSDKNTLRKKLKREREPRRRRKTVRAKLAELVAKEQILAYALDNRGA